MNILCPICKKILKSLNLIEGYYCVNCNEIFDMNDCEIYEVIWR